LLTVGVLEDNSNWFPIFVIFCKTLIVISEDNWLLVGIVACGRIILICCVFIDVDEIVAVKAFETD